MFCRKCGNKKTTRREAGVFHCKRCGMQPCRSNFDRFGNAAPVEQYADAAPLSDYVFAKRTPRLRAGSAAQ